jgi:hypothetical protein
MRTAWASLFCAAMLAASAVGTASAGRAVHIKGVDISFSALDEGLTKACRFPVTFTRVGTASYTLVYGKDGTVIREVDTEPGTKITVSGNGRSYTSANDPILITKYPEGATLGAPATMIFTGIFFKFPGTVPNAGPDFITGHVEGFTPEGVPLVSFDDVVASHGPRPDFVEAVCTALGS